VKRLKLWFWVVIVVLLAIAGVYIVYSWSVTRPVSQVTEAQTVPVERGTLVVTVKAIGHVEAPPGVSLSFDSSGCVARLTVAEGDRITRGQVIAELDRGPLEQAVERAQAALTVAEAQFAAAQAGPSEEDLAIAQAGVRLAEAGVATAEALLGGAKASLARVTSGATEEEIGIAQRRVEEAKNVLWGAQAQRDAVCGRVDKYGITEADCDGAQAAVQQAEESVRIAELQLQQLLSGARPADVAAAQSEVDRASANLEAAKAQLEQAQASYERLKKGPRSEQVRVAQAQLESARVELELAEERLQKAALVSPVAGTVVEVSRHVGECVTAGMPVVTVVDLGELFVKANVNETYIHELQVGQEAVLYLESVPTRAFRGRVRRIDDVAQTIAGVINYGVEIALSDVDSSILKPGMITRVAIVVAERPDALLVPKGALRVRDGRWYVQTLRDGDTQEVFVKVGAREGRQVEILKGLVESDRVVLATTSLGTEHGDYLWLPFGILRRVR